MRLKSMFVMGIVLALSACGDKVHPIGPEPVYADVYTPGMLFTPTPLTVSVGTIVRFNIFGDVVEGHDVTFRNTPGAPASIPVTKQATVSREFNTKGTFQYDCFTHPGMSGVVIVQ